MFQAGTNSERVDAALQVLASGAGGGAAMLAPYDPAPSLPREIFEPALALFERGERVDMRSLAGEIGIGRTSLYRKAGSREALLGELCWELLKCKLRLAVAAAEERRGIERVLIAAAVVMDELAGETWLERFLEREASCALRVLLDRSGPVQRGLARATYALLEAELQRGSLAAGTRPELLAYPIVRTCESYLYLDIVNGRAPDIAGAVAAISALMHGQARPLGLLARREPALDAAAQQHADHSDGLLNVR